MNRNNVNIEPDFLVIGAAKSGTTSLCDLLGQHPQIFVSNPKEICYFSFNSNFERGWLWYLDFFKGSERKLARGEGCPSYTMRTGHPETARRIASALPEVKLIYIVRHPLDRIVSNWRMMVRVAGGPPDFNKAVQDERYQATLLHRSKYWFQINAYRDLFPDDRILVLFFEDFKRDPNETLARCFDFLGVGTKVNLDQPGQARNKAEDRGSATHFRLLLRKFGLSRQVRTLLPDSIWSQVRRLSFLTRSTPVPVPEWDHAVRQWAVEKLAEDTERFLTFYGKPVTFWEF